MLHRKAVKDYGRKGKFFFKFHFPLFPQCCRKNDQNPFHALADDIFQGESCFNGFAKPYFVGEDQPPGFYCLDSGTKRIDLVRVQFYVGVKQTTIWGFLQRQLLGPTVLFKHQVAAHSASPMLFNCSRIPWAIPFAMMGGTALPICMNCADRGPSKK